MPAPALHRPPFPWGRALAWAALGAMLAITLAPLWLVLKTALEHPQALLANAAGLLPAEPTLLNFRRVLGLVSADESMAVGGSGADVDMARALGNSLLFTALVVVLQTGNSAMAAYAFARLQFPGKRLLFAAVVGSMMLPGVVLFIPNFIFIKQLGWAILNAAGLSFIGLGVRPPTPEWGILVAEGAQFIVSGEWWVSFFPGAVLMLAVFTFNLLGDALRDIFDPRRRT